MARQDGGKGAVGRFLDRHKKKPTKSQPPKSQAPKSQPPKVETPPAQKDPTDLKEIEDLLVILAHRVGAPRPAFHLGNFDRYFEKLTYEAHDAGAVSDMVDQVLRHYGLDPARIHTQVIYDAGGPGSETAHTRGTYAGTAAGHGQIQVRLEPEYSDYDTVISIALHECAHYFNALRGLRLEDTQKNERLTDLTAIWLGGGDYLLRGYFFLRVRVGYLTEAECRYAVEQVQRRREQHEMRAREAVQRQEARRREALAAARRELARAEGARALDAPPPLLCEAETAGKIRRLLDTQETRRQVLAARCAQAEGVRLAPGTEEVLEGVLEDLERERQAMSEATGALGPYLRARDAQAALPETVRAHLRGMLSLAEAGNVFGLFEKLRLYAACGQQEDAALVFFRIEGRTDRDGAYVLGRCYLEGIHVPKDLVLAAYHLETAASLGSEAARRDMERLRRPGDRP